MAERINVRDLSAPGNEQQPAGQSSGRHGAASSPQRVAPRLVNRSQGRLNRFHIRYETTADFRPLQTRLAKKSAKFALVCRLPSFRAWPFEFW
jgi:hypothetical protein